MHMCWNLRFYIFVSYVELKGLVHRYAPKISFPGNASENTYCFIILLFDNEIVQKKTREKVYAESGVRNHAGSQENNMPKNPDAPPTAPVSHILNNWTVQL